jgi:hypothetical protein
MKKGAYAETVFGGPQHPEANAPMTLIDPEHIGHGQWRGRKKPKKGAISANAFFPGKEPKFKHSDPSLQYPLIAASLDPEPIALVIAPSLCKGFKHTEMKPVDQLNPYEMGQEIKNLAWLIESAESRTTPNFEAIRQMRQRLLAIRENIDLRHQLRCSLGLEKGFPTGKKPELAAAGDKPAKHAKRGVNPQTGKQKYDYAEPKAGKSSASAPKAPGKDEKPLRHTHATVSARLSVHPTELHELAQKTSAKEFEAHLRTHKLADLVQHGIHSHDLKELHRELSAKRG